MQGAQAGGAVNELGGLDPAAAKSHGGGHPILAEVDRIDEESRRGDYSLAQGLYRTIIAIDPTIVPNYRGYRLDETGLNGLARQALDLNPTALEVMREIFESGCLSTYAVMRGSDWQSRVEQLWQRQVQSFVGLATFVPEAYRQDLEANLSLAVAAGLLDSLETGAAWSRDLRGRAEAQRLRGRHVPAWYAQLESHIPALPAAALIGVAAVRPRAAEEAAVEEQRRRESNAANFRRALTFSRVLLALAVAALAVVGIAALLNAF